MRWEWKSPRLISHRPEKIEIFLADIWEMLDDLNSELRKAIEEVVGLDGRTAIMNRILGMLPSRFNIYFVVWQPDEQHESRNGRDFFTEKAAENYKSQSISNEQYYAKLRIRIFRLNAIQMRMTIIKVMKEIHEDKTVPPLGLDEREEINLLEKFLH